MLDRTRARLTFARAIDEPRATELAERFAATHRDPDAHALAVAVATAFPAFSMHAERHPDDFEDVSREGIRFGRDRQSYLAMLRADVGSSDGDRFQRILRRFVSRERLRIAARELLPGRLGGADVDVTAREVSDLAEACVEVALEEAEESVARRFGKPLREGGAPSRMVVLGMGKLGGRELNVGSDIDLLYVYDSDEGDPASDLTLHEWWGRVARRLTTTLEEVTEDGAPFRVDLRLRPEGSRGAVVNSVAAAIRYYENWGRPWERAALLRARPIAGDLALGDALLAELSPFVYRRKVDPAIAAELFRLVVRSREELSRDADRDLKLGEGGIREAEFFVQALQLIWGGQEASVRVPSFFEALRRLYAASLVSDRETREVSDAYLLLRRAEHRVQWMTGLQTHALPEAGPDLARLARSLGYAEADDFLADLRRSRARVHARFLSLAPAAAAGPFDDIAARLFDEDDGVLTSLVERLAPPNVSAGELAKDLAFLGRRPDDPLGRATAERHPAFPSAFIEAILDAADPELAARAFRAVFARIASPAVYVSPMAEDPRALQRLATVFGASAFVGQRVAHHPELRDRVLFARRAPTPEEATAEILDDLSTVTADPHDPEELVGALRRAKQRLLVDVALADLAGEVEIEGASRLLSTVADVTLSATAQLAAGAYPGDVRGLSIIALGKLGGRELGYGSDLDVIFLFEPDLAPPNVDPAEHFARLAQRIVRWVTSPHQAGAGYELDARLRPSGSQGMLVTTLASFARYHGASASAGAPMAGGAAPWERQALVRARFCAGDPEIGARAMQIAEAAAFEGGPPEPEELHRMRMRMEEELSGERAGRYNLKTGHGGLVDVEFVTQFLQMKHGADPRVRSPETARALAALRDAGYVDRSLAEELLDGHRFLRRLEQRIHIVHASSAQLVDEQAPGLLPLARRMGLRDAPGRSATEALVAQYRDVTDRVRAAYAAVLGVEAAARPPHRLH